MKQVRREQLDPRLRPVFDELLIDALSQSGNGTSCNRGWRGFPRSIRPSRLDRDGDRGDAPAGAGRPGSRRRSCAFGQALDLWDEVIRLAWPAGSEFPAQFTRRVVQLVESDAPRRRPAWRDRLRRAAGEMDGNRGKFPQASVVDAELAGVETRLSGGR